MRRFVWTCALLTACLLLAACGGAGAKAVERTAKTDSDELQFVPPSEGDTVATISTEYGDIHILLYPQYAPMAVENFIGLAQQGYYNGVSFHRVVKDFLIQTGDAGGTGTGGSTVWNGTPFPVEISDKLHHYTGAVAMAHPSGDAGGNTSQFYIVQTPTNSVDKSAGSTLAEAGLRQAVIDAYRDVGGAPYLDNLYTVFGQVYDGMAVVDEIAKVKCNESGQPEEPVYVTGITISQYTAPVANSTVSSTAPGSDPSSSSADSVADSAA